MNEHEQKILDAARDVNHYGACIKEWQAKLTSCKNAVARLENDREKPAAESQLKTATIAVLQAVQAGAEIPIDAVRDMRDADLTIGQWQRRIENAKIDERAALRDVEQGTAKYNEAVAKFKAAVAAARGV